MLQESDGRWEGKGLAYRAVIYEKSDLEHMATMSIK